MASQNSNDKAPLVSIAPINKDKAKKMTSPSTQPSGSNPKILPFGLNQKTSPKPYSSSSSTTIRSNPPVQLSPHVAIAKKEAAYTCFRCNRRFNDIPALRAHQNVHRVDRVMFQNRAEVPQPTPFQGFGYPPLNSEFVMGNLTPRFAPVNRPPHDLLNMVPVINRPYVYHPIHQFANLYQPHAVPMTIESLAPPLIQPNHFLPRPFVAPFPSRFPHLMPHGFVSGVPNHFMHRGPTPRFSVMGNTAGSPGVIAVHEGLPNFNFPPNTEWMSNNLMNGQGNQKSRESSIDLSLRL